MTESLGSNWRETYVSMQEERGIPNEVPVAPELRVALIEQCVRPLILGEVAIGEPDGSHRYFVDIDQVGSFDSNAMTQPSADMVSNVSQTVADAIAAIAEKDPVDSLVFLHRTSGPIGMLGFRASLTEKTGLPSMVVRPHLRLLDSQVRPSLATLLQQRKASRFGSPNTSPHILFVTDVTATGEEVVDAAKPLWQHEIRSLKVLSLFDTNEGARSFVGTCEIPLTTLISLESVDVPKQPNSTEYSC